MFNEKYRIRTFDFALSVLKSLRQVSDNQETKILKHQLIRSSTSMASNFRAACVSRSEREWHSKISIVIEEADESQFWLELLEKLYPENSDALAQLKLESNELLKIFSKARGKLSFK